MSAIARETNLGFAAINVTAERRKLLNAISILLPSPYPLLIRNLALLTQAIARVGTE